jgi:AcrR family transcriptional regulator
MTMTKPPNAEQLTAGDTRSALIEAGLRIFGRKGFDAASTREIAAAANTNIGSIAYHFGGKEGLRLACAEAIVTRMTQVARPAQLAAGTASPEAAMDLIERVIRDVTQFTATHPEASDIVAFMMREMTTPSAALDRIYEVMICPIHQALCQLWAVATGADADSADTRLRVFSLIGQTFYFRIARPVVGKRMGWDSIGPDEADAISAVLIANLRAIAKGLQEGRK